MSNLYANSINKDNPSILWTLDEDLQGVTPITLPSDISISSSVKGYVASYYGSGHKDAYYLGNTTAISAKSGGMPLVYGSTGTTTLYENKISGTNYPSIIFPGFGFMNDDGKNNSITFEFWLRVLPQTNFPRRIFGPINSTDGLYINGSILSLKVEDKLAHHFVGEWGKPMLIDVTYTSFAAGLLINGDQVLTISHDLTNLQMINKYDDNGKDQDWLGIYAYDNVVPLQIDCVAIYPYQISPKTAKLHFVKGQAVENTEIKNTSYKDFPTVIDYTLSKYSKNYTYPINGKWQNGVIDNLQTINNKLSSPNYSLPNLYFSDATKTLSDWYIAQTDISTQNQTESIDEGSNINNDVFFRINPDEVGNEWNSDGYIHFSNMSMIQGQVKSFYGVFSYETALPASKEIMFKFVNKNGEYFEISSLNRNITYSYFNGSSTTTISSLTNAISATLNTKFNVGVDIDSIVAAHSDLRSFFYNAAGLEVFIGGSSSFTNTLSANIYKIGFSNIENHQKIKDKFTSGILSSSDEMFASYFASYTLIGINTFDSFSLDIALNGSWRDYIPAKLISKNVGGIYKLSFAQLNIDYPETNNELNASIRSYIEFSPIVSSSVSTNQAIVSKTDVEKDSNSIIEPDSNWINKRYEFVDNTIMYLPSAGYSSVDTLGITTYIDFYIPGIFRNPVSIKTYEIAAQTFISNTVPTEIGTKHGKNIHSHTSSGYDGNNPYTIYKGNTPYLYLSKNSGIKLIGSTFDRSREIVIPINQFNSEFYTVSTIQASIFYDKDFDDEYPVFDIYRDTADLSKSRISIIATPDISDSSMAILSAKQYNSVTDTYSNYTDIEIYINGKLYDSTKYTKIKKNEWATVTLQFLQNLSFSRSPGDTKKTQISITGPFLINNIADYQIDQSKINTNLILRTWEEVLGSTNTWNMYDTEYAWGIKDETREGLLETATIAVPQLDPIKIYRSSIGTNKMNGYQDQVTFRALQDLSTLYSEIRYDTLIIEPL